MFECYNIFNKVEYKSFCLYNCIKKLFSFFTVVHCLGFHFIFAILYIIIEHISLWFSVVLFSKCVILHYYS